MNKNAGRKLLHFSMRFEDYLLHEIYIFDY